MFSDEFLQRYYWLHPLVRGIYQDKAAVQAGLTLEWNQGQTEGQITRLKLIKRQGYGRASFQIIRNAPSSQPE